MCKRLFPFLALTLLICIFVYLHNRFFICVVHSNSMEPTLSEHDILVCERVNSDLSEFSDINNENGQKQSKLSQNLVKDDLIVFRDVENPKRFLVKRIKKIMDKGSRIIVDVVGKDSIAEMVVRDGAVILNRNNSIYIDGQKKNYYELKQNFFYVQGDNCSSSRDSRTFGWIPEKSLIGIPRYLFFTSGNGNCPQKNNRICIRLK